ncbi:MAG: acetolactate synthase, large subunit, biosynthetic type [Omnitrophica bacterium RIFCSPLOWO2_12_FULL_44_17]|uniref:Acetolactate synthase n=1 Tax=Candidatus Danuiimicrobium aquiferis TaxID=1801832 RepID=A0A1G1L2P7_9BACT|nr:MAG: acetolactate synthase, large subunit, biosynthetic type [Omnitrophica bacterium RIFCSPHIGHO2_02_FULL_45_28]OGW92483.1 MAG: acetolactate synthase, large subunit, biosynthetic type [Omnitrophica bacterium RIFCSPHIGHO2_12_FULL_44_12]OGW99149.1 MAG: acetolactate synthase, large subunit, biosynthetic type [Omnitrophica bacterium RIFCSPLOWO2_12_FULL_44_17]
MAKMTGAQIMVKCLEMLGVEYVFGLPGGVILPTFDVLYDSKKLKFILVRHEQGATHMADGYARATGRPGVCLVTSGPGATNTVTGLATAYMDSSPVICITGQVPTHAIGMDAFQEADIVGITRPITKHNFLLKDVKDIARVMREAFYIATTGRPGPVLVDFPVDVSRAITEFEFPERIYMRAYRPSREIDMEQIKKAAEAINKSKRPCLYVGGGTIASDASKELREFVEKTGIPVTTTILGLGAFPEDHPLSLRMLGMHGSAYANYTVQRSDLLISVGARFDDRVTGNISKFAPDAKVVHIDIDPSSISKTVRVDYPILGDIKPVLRELIPLVKNRRQAIKPWMKQIQEWKKKHPLRYNQDDSEIRQEYVIDQIGKLTDHKAVVVTGVGQHQMWTAQWYQFSEPRTMITSGGLGTMGFGLPAAIGAQIGRPEKTVVCIDGDGSFHMTLAELTTAKYYKIPVKIVVLDNGYFGMVRQWQELFYNRRYSASVLSLLNPDFSEVAKAFGIYSVQVRKKEDVVAGLKKILSHKGPALLHVLVKGEQNVFPMVPAGNALDQIMDMA